MRHLIVEVRDAEKPGETKLLRVQVPDGAKCTLQGANPTKNTMQGTGNPIMLRIYVGSDKQQIASIPHVVMWRDEDVLVEELVSKANVVGKVWEPANNSIFSKNLQWTVVREESNGGARGPWKMQPALDQGMEDDF